MDKSLTKDKGRLEAELERLKVKVSEAKNIGATEFKEFTAYKSSLTTTIAMFFTKEKIKMERFLWKHHNIKDQSCLAHQAEEPIFSTNEVME